MDTLKYNWKVLYMMTTRTIHAFLTGAALARQSSFYCPRLTFYCPKKLRHKATESVATQQAFGCSIASILRGTVQTFVSCASSVPPQHFALQSAAAFLGPVVVLAPFSSVSYPFLAPPLFWSNVVGFAGPCPWLGAAALGSEHHDIHRLFPMFNAHHG